MNLKWIFALILLVYSFDVFSSEIQFNDVIEASQSNQKLLASNIQSQLWDTQRKTPEQLTVSHTVSLEGSVLKVY